MIVPVVWPSKPKFTVAVPPLSLGRNRFNGVPMLRDLAVLHAKQIVEGRVSPTEVALTDDDDKIALAKDGVNAFVLQGNALLHHGSQGSGQAREPVRNLRIVLHVVVAVEVARELLHLTVDQNVRDEVLDERLVGGCRARVRCLYGSVNHR